MPLLDHVATTRDGRIKVYVYRDQTAEIRAGTGALIMGNAPLYKVAEKLAEMGIDAADLVRA